MANKKDETHSASNRPLCSTVVLYLCVVALFVRVELLNFHLRKEMEQRDETMKTNILKAKRSLQLLQENAVSRPKRSLPLNFSSLFEKEFAKKLKLLKSNCLFSASHKLFIMRGVPGPRGRRGKKGRRGKDGKRGQPGKQGKTGLRGPPGLPGIAGPRGKTGKMGKTGMQGPPGLPGRNGINGKPGLQGPVGPPGPRGERGESISSPTVVASPVSLTVNQSNNATFFCSAHGNPKPEVVWIKVNGSLAPGKTKVSLNGKLVVTAADHSDSGKYQCVASNVLGQDNTTVHLHVQVPARITRPPSQQLVEDGKSALFTCEVWGVPKPTVTWNKIPGHLPYGRIVLTEEKLRIVNTSKSDGGVYTCSARNILRKVTSSALLVIIPRPKFTKRPPVNITVFSGDVVTLHCQAISGTVQLGVSWNKAHGQLPQGYKLLKNGTLIMKVTSVTHSGTYRCTARNLFSTITANTVLTVRQYAKTCSALRRAGHTKNQRNKIDPDGSGGGTSFFVYCDMTDRGGVGVTVISHDGEARTLVNGYNSRGSYSRNIKYTGVSKTQMVNLITASMKCEQFIKYECYDSRLLYNSYPYGWWVSRDGQKMTYWGGATPGSAKCACGVTNTCATRGNTCNCDTNDNTWREDSGFLTDKRTLPVSQLRFGDTGSGEKGYHTLGKFKCYGET